MPLFSLIKQYKVCQKKYQNFINFTFTNLQLWSCLRHSSWNIRKQIWVWTQRWLSENWQ